MMQIEEAIILPDRSRSPFFDGMETQPADLTFRCDLCGVINVIDLWLFLSESEKWQQHIGAEQVQKLRKQLQLPRCLGFFKSHEGGQPYLGIFYCSNCRAQYLLYVGFYEFQPARYFATLQGLYRLANENLT